MSHIVYPCSWKDPYAHYSNLPYIVFAGQPRFQMSLNFKYIDGNSYIHLFIPNVRNELFFGTIRLLGLSAYSMHSMQNLLVRIMDNLYVRLFILCSEI